VSTVTWVGDWPLLFLQLARRVADIEGCAYWMKR
jgi:hypothetical protein